MMLPFVNILPAGPTGLGAAKPIGGEPTSFGVGDGQTFESLMNLFGMAEPSANILSINSGNAESDQDSADPSTGTTAFTSLMMGLQQPSPNVVAPTITETSEPTAKDLLATDRQILASSLKQLTEPQVALDPKLALPSVQPWTMTLAQQRQIELKPGKYQVIKQEINNGKLTLDLKSGENAAEPVKVTIPIELLHQESRDAITPVVKQATGVQNPVKRVTLYSTSQADLEQLIGKVNLREMEVKIEPTHAVYQASVEPMSVQIFAEQQGQNFMLAGKLNRTQLKATVSTKRSITSLATLPGDENPTPSAANGLTVDSVSLPRQRVGRPIAFEADGDTKTEDFMLIEKLLSTTPKNNSTQQDGFEQFALDSKNSASQATVEQRMQMPRVKITLPQEMPQLKSDGQTIMLRIEPEHLGPAKLQLTLRNDSLSARVTVESVQAKAAVEGSLDQLNDQLSRAGLKVNYIEVGVRGGGANNQFFQRQSDWFRSQQPRVAKISNDLLAEAAKIIPASMPVSYIGASSVNLYA
jgi:flagellar hook-length control protein FliK